MTAAAARSNNDGRVLRLAMVRVEPPAAARIASPWSRSRVRRRVALASGRALARQPARVCACARPCSLSRIRGAAQPRRLSAGLSQANSQTLTDTLLPGACPQTPAGRSRRDAQGFCEAPIAGRGVPIHAVPSPLSSSRPPIASTVRAPLLPASGPCARAAHTPHLPCTRKSHAGSGHLTSSALTRGATHGAIEPQRALPPPRARFCRRTIAPAHSSAAGGQQMGTAAACSPKLCAEGAFVYYAVDARVVQASSKRI